MGNYSSMEEENYLSREGIFHTGLSTTYYYHGGNNIFRPGILNAILQRNEINADSFILQA